MGCDIHMYVEKRVNGRWVKLSGFLSSMYDKDSKYFSEERFLKSDEIFSCRNYSLFSLLAGVREYEDNEPIISPRGVPSDVSPEVEKEISEWGCNGHTHHWYTLNELLDFDWISRKTNHAGFVSVNEYRRFKEDGEPYGWCKGISGPPIISNSEMDDLLASGHIEKFGSPYTYIKWTTVNEYQYFQDHVFPQLKERSSEPDFSDVRIVFWFDN